MKKILLNILLLLSALVAHGQHTVSGIISDQADKTKLVEGVSVFIPELQKFDFSEQGGTYILRGIGSGTVSIQFTKIGYKSVVKTVTTKDSATVLNIEMEPSTTELEEITVTSNSTKLPDNVPYPVNTVSRDDLNRLGNVNLLTSITSQPGVDKISVGNGIAKPVIRGLSFSRILLYQDGTRIENQPWDDRHDLGINENGVDKVEIIKGPAALIYGADALGGALIFTDEKPAVAGTTVGSVNTGFFSNTLGLNLDAGLKGTKENGLFWSARFGAQSHTSYIQGEGLELKKNTEEEEFAANSKFQTLNGKAIIGLSKKWGVSKLSYSVQNQQIGIVELEEGDSLGGSQEEEGEQREREFEAPYQDVTSHIISSENTFIAGKSKWNLNLSYQYNNRKEFEPIIDTATNTPIRKSKEDAIGLKLNTITYDLKWNSDAEKKFGLTIGTQGMFQKNENFGKEMLVPNADVSDMGFYALLRYDIGKWNFLAGGRFDLRHIEVESEREGEEEEEDSLVMRPEIDFEKDYKPINGSIGIAFRPTEELTLKGNFASGFSAPNYAELGTYGKHEGAYRFEIGNQKLEIEQNFESDLGLIWETKSLSFNLSGYYNFINDYIYIGPTGDSIELKSNTLPIYTYRQGDAKISGAEVSVDIHPATAQWIDLLNSFSITKGELSKGGNLPWIPAKKLITELKFKKDKIRYIHSPFVSIVMSNYLKQEDVAEFELPTDSYTLFDLHIGGTFKWANQLMDVTVSVTNILNEGYFNHLSLVKSIGVKEMGRDIVLQLRIPFGIKSKAK